jgi:hypothetical protein
VEHREVDNEGAFWHCAPTIEFRPSRRIACQFASADGSSILQKERLLAFAHDVRSCQQDRRSAAPGCATDRALFGGCRNDDGKADGDFRGRGLWPGRHPDRLAPVDHIGWYAANEWGHRPLSGQAWDLLWNDHLNGQLIRHDPAAHLRSDRCCDHVPHPVRSTGLMKLIPNPAQPRGLPETYHCSGLDSGSSVHDSIVVITAPLSAALR